MRRSLLFVGIMLCLFVIESKAAVIFVDSSHIGGIQTGNSWATAFSDLQLGINASNHGDSIFVAKGTYQPALNASFMIKDGVNIYGGFLSGGSVIRDWVNNPTILKGNGNSVVQNVDIVDTIISPVIDGVQITNGKGLMINNSCYGGGVYSLTHLVIQNSSIFNNVAFSHSNDGNAYGGGIYSKNGTLVIVNTTIYGDTACSHVPNGTNAYGGGIYNEDTMAIVYSAISGNVAMADSAFGGGIYNVYEAILSECNVNNNYSQSTSSSFYSYGGGIYNKSGLTISNTDVRGNFTNTGGTNASLGSYGGGIFSTGNVSIGLSNVIHNSANKGGGIFNAGLVDATLSTVDSNNAWIAGGGIYNSSTLHFVNGSVSFNNHEISSNNVTVNYPSYGGGLYNSDSANVSNSVISNNVVMASAQPAYGGGVFNAGRLYSNGNAFASNKDTAQFGAFGGAIYSVNSSVQSYADTFTGNWAKMGAAIFIDSLAALPCKINKGNFIGNKALFYGGGIYNKVINTALISNCNFKADTAINGAGIYNNKTASLIVNSVFSRNVVDSFGAAIYNQLSTPDIVNCTMLLNKANVAGSGMYNAGNAHPYVVNTILWGNASGIDNEAGSAATVNYSLVQGINGNAVNHNIDGYTNPLFIDTSGIGDYHLQVLSLCINSGSNDSLPTYITTDISGQIRIAGSIIDMGAYEFAIPPTVNLGPDTAVCAEKGITLNANNGTASSYLWNTGANTPSIFVTTSGTYYVTVSNLFGTASDTVRVAVLQPPVVNLGNDTNLATGSSIVLDAGNPGQDYLWNTNATTQTIIVTTGGIYSVTVTDTAGCSGTDTIKVSFGTAVNNINNGKQQWVLYPNPTKGNIVLSTDNASLLHSKAVLTDISGKVIAVYMIDKKRQPLSLSGLNSGIYLLMMDNGEVFKVGKE